MEQRAPQVVVVGAGIAGLGAAWALQKKGYRVLVLEAAAVPGGRMGKRQVKGYTLDTGAQFLAGRGAYRHLWKLMDELHLSSGCRPIGAQTNVLVRGGKVYSGKWTDPRRLVSTGYLSNDAKFSLLKILPQLTLGIVQLDPLHPEEAAHLDHEDARTWLCRLMGEEVADYVFEPAFGATFDTDLSQLSRAFVMNSLIFMSKGFVTHSPDGGPGAVTAALASRLDVRYGARVTALSATPKGVDLRYEDAGGKGHELAANGVVLAVPAPRLGALADALIAQERDFLHHVRYVKGIIVNLCLKDRPATLNEAYGIGLPPPEGFGLYGAAVDHHKPHAVPQGAGLVNAALRASEAEARWEHGDEALTAFAVGELERGPAGALGEVVHAEVDRWEHMLPTFYPGYYKLLKEFLHREHHTPRVQLAGDYLVGPFTEAAYVSGLRAAVHLHYDLIRTHHHY